MNDLNYVKYIYEHEILIYCENKEKTHSLLLIKAKRKFFKKNLWKLKYQDKGDLAKKLQLLNDNDFMFLGGAAGWNPVDIYISMREKNQVSGKVVEISWVNQKQTTLRIL